MAIPFPPAQLPHAGQIFLDHVGHFVRDPDAARRALLRAGFSVTPFSVQTLPDPSGGAPQPTGTGNLCAMLRRGYVEVLARTADTPLAVEFDAALRGHEGLHLAAFAVADPPDQHARLAAAGFPMRPLVYFERAVELPGGPGLAAFRVVRLERGAMPEGRIQALAHLTEAAVWQPRWLDHPNGASGLLACVFRVTDLREAVPRFERFLDRPATQLVGGAMIALDRGALLLAAPGRAQPFGPSAGPGGLGYAVLVQSLDHLADALDVGGIGFRKVGACLMARFPEGLGNGFWCFVATTEDFDPQILLDFRD